MGTYRRHNVSEKLFPYKTTGCFYITLTAHRSEPDSLIFTAAIPYAAERLMKKMGMWTVFFDCLEDHRELAEELQPEFEFWYEKLTKHNHDRFRGYVPRYEVIMEFIRNFRDAIAQSPDALVHVTSDPLFDPEPSNIIEYPKWTYYGQYGSI